jgi:Ca2+-binding RTX toxin-like protein
MTINLAVGTATGEGTDSLSNIENVSGSAYADTMIGNTGANSLTGNAGNDTLNGGAGADSLTGGANNDIFVLDDTTFSGIDTIQDFNSSNDKIIIANLFPYYDPWVHTITDYVQITDSGSNSILKVDIDGGGNSFVQVATIIGVTGLTNELALQNSDTVRTYNTISGTSGADTLTGGANFDYIFADYGNDTLYGGAGNDRLDGAWDNDTLYGQDGNDVLEAGSGNDTLYGGAGADILYSHGGNDIFVLDDTTFSGVDTIQDFNSSNDKIDIADVLVGYDALTEAITDFVQITTSGSNSILSVDADGGANNFVQIATIIGVTGLTNEEALETAGTLITV